MALILAINPQGRQTAALERLARELAGHELIGADSCAVAKTAVDRRLPDLVLLPPQPESGQDELVSHLRNVPGGVRILTLPAVLQEGNPAVDSPTSFANQVRQSLAVAPGRAQLIAAGFAVAKWIRARRAGWSGAPAYQTPARDFAREPAAAVYPPPPPRVIPPAPVAPPPLLRREPPRPPEPIEEPVAEMEEPAGPSFASTAADTARDVRASIMAWLPRVAALGVIAALAAAGYTYLPKLRTAVTSGEVVLESGPAGSQVFIDGNLVGKTPVTTTLPAGRHTVEFRNGDMSRMKELNVTARERLVERVDWRMKPTGSLQVESDPPGARVLVDGVFRGNTPLTVETLSLGTHAVVVETREGSVRRTVVIEDGKTSEVTESIFSGALAIFAPFEIESSEGNKQLRLDERGRATLAAGPHTLRFQNRALGYNEVRTVEIKPGETISLNLVPQTTLNVTANEPAEVSIDGTRVGPTPVSGAKVTLGTRSVVVKNAAGDERRFTVTATAKPVQLDVDFTRPQ